MQTNGKVFFTAVVRKRERMKRYIDADGLLNGLKSDPLYPLVKKYGIERAIDAQPTADVRENVPGKWWHEPHTNNTWIQRCSNCFHVAMITVEEECPYNYCPLCGADMRGEKNEI
jgi:hypothetical protein